MDDLKLEYLPPEALLPYAGNARAHSAAQVRQIQKSMKAFGFMNPILIDGDNRLIAGHGRLLAAKKLGLNRVPCVRAEHLSEVQRRAYILADNKIAENASWDPGLLRIELEFLTHVEFDFDVELSGFSTGEINLALAPPEDLSDPSPPEPPPAAQVVCRPGDVWALFDHRVACGDARDLQLVASLLDGEAARMVITDPPFNVKVAGHVSGLGKHKHGEFAMASGEMSPEQFVSFLEASLGAAARVCRDGALLYVFMDWRHLQDLQIACAKLGLSVVNLCVWVKTNGGMGSLYRSQHELVLVLKKGKAPHVNNVELGKHGRYRTNVWTYAGMNSFGGERNEALAVHPTVKPVAMIADAIKDASRHGEIVLDVFLGSGTTLLAAERSQRRCYGVELDPGYVDVALTRWMELSGAEAVHLESELTFSQLKERRLRAAAESEAVTDSEFNQKGMPDAFEA